MNKKIIFFLFVFFSAGAALAQDTAAKNNAEIEITAERRKNPNTKANPHPGGVVTSERTRNPQSQNSGKPQQPAQPVITEQRSGKPQD